MKRFVASIIILIFITATSIASLFYLKSVKNELISSLEQIDVYVKKGDNNSAISLADKIFDYYLEQNDFLILFVEHERLEELEETLSRLSPLLRSNDSGEFSAEVSKAVTLTEKLYDHEKPTPKNIL